MTAIFVHIPAEACPMLVLPAETLMNSDWLMTAMLFKCLLKTDWLIHAHDSESCYFKSVIPKIIPQLHNMPAHVFGLLIMFGKNINTLKQTCIFIKLKQPSFL